MRTFQDIQSHFQGNFKMEGVPYCCAVCDDLILIGFSDGSVFVYDQDEAPLRHLKDKSVKNSSVVSMDVTMSDSGVTILATGHQKGQVAIWEISDSRNLTGKHIKSQETCFRQAVVCLKFYGTSYEDDYNTSSKPCYRVIASDLEGEVYLIWFLETAVLKIRKISAHAQLLMKPSAGGFFSITSITLDPERQAQKILFALGSLDMVMILEIKNIEGKVIQKIPRPNYVQPGSVPYLAWGFGLTPVFRDRAYFLLAITWGQTV